MSQTRSVDPAALRSIVKRRAERLGRQPLSTDLDTIGLDMLLADCAAIGLPPRALALLVAQLSSHLACQNVVLLSGLDNQSSDEVLNIGGLPRSGTTLLSWLMAAAGIFEYPTIDGIENPRGALDEPAHRSQVIQRLVPGFLGLHPEAPDRPEETDAIAQHVFRSFRVAVSYPLRDYLAWLSREGAVTGFDYAHRFLSHGGQRRLLCKNPFLFASREPHRFETLGITIVIMRELNSSFTSWCHFVSRVQRGLGSESNPEIVARQWAPTYTIMLRRVCNCLRDANGSVIMVPYEALTKDPVATTERLCEMLGYGSERRSSVELRHEYRRIANISVAQENLVRTRQPTTIPRADVEAWEDARRDYTRNWYG